MAAFSSPETRRTTTGSVLSASISLWRTGSLTTPLNGCDQSVDDGGSRAGDGAYLLDGITRAGRARIVATRCGRGARLPEANGRLARPIPSIAAIEHAVGPISAGANGARHADARRGIQNVPRSGACPGWRSLVVTHEGNQAGDLAVAQSAFTGKRLASMTRAFAVEPRFALAIDVARREA